MSFPVVERRFLAAIQNCTVPEARKERSCQFFSASHLGPRADCPFHRPAFFRPGFPVCPRAQHLLRTQFCVRDTKMFLILFRNILCPQQMFPSLRARGNVMSNNVSATIATLRNRTAGRLRTAEWRIKMSRKTGNAQSRAIFFRHSAVLSLPAVLLRKVANVSSFATALKLRCLHRF